MPRHCTSKNQSQERLQGTLKCLLGAYLCSLRVTRGNTVAYGKATTSLVLRRINCLPFRTGMKA